MQIDFPWPSPLLSPNARLHWSRKAGQTRITRRTAWVVAHAALGGAKGVAPVAMTITLHPPDNRRRDRDNIIASLKSTMDGLADALGVDDAHFVPTYAMGAPVKAGRVTVEITSALRIPHKGTISCKD